MEILRIEVSPDEAREHSPTFGKITTYVLVSLKVLELLLIIACICMMDKPGTGTDICISIAPRVAALSFVTFGCLLIYNIVFIMMTLYGDLIPWRTSAVWSIVGFILYAVTSGLLYHVWYFAKDTTPWNDNMERLDLVLGASGASAVAAIVFIVDIFATIRFGLRGGLD